MSGAEDVFTDTSVLFNYTLNDDDGSARQLIITHPCCPVTAESVKREFEDVKETRKKICNEMLSFLGQGDIENYEPSFAAELSDNDESFVEDFRSELSGLPQVQAEQRINDKIREFNAGYTDLFQGTNRYLRLLDVSYVDGHLKGHLEPIVTNSADCEIICHATDWTSSGGSGIFISSDKSDTLGYGNQSSNGDEDESSGIPDTFAGLVEGDGRTLREKINEKIEGAPEYGSSCTLDIYSAAEYLNT